MPSNHERHLPSRPDTRHRLRLVRLLIALLAAIAAIAAMECIVFNLPFWRTLGASTDTNAVHNTLGSGLTRRNDGMLTVTDPTKAYLELTADGTSDYLRIDTASSKVIDKAREQAEAESEANDDKEVFKPLATIHVRADVDGITGKAQSMNPDAIRSHYVKAPGAGIVRIWIQEERGAIVPVTDARANVRVPFVINWMRVLAMALVLLMIAVWRPGSRLWRITLDPSSTRQRLAFVGLMAIPTLLIGASIIHELWYASPLVFHVSGDYTYDFDQYGHVADALVAGRPWLDLPVPEQLAATEHPYDVATRAQLLANGASPLYWDYAYYDGHWYSYFGVLPAVLLFVPYRLLTGHNLPTSAAEYILVLLFIIFFSLLVLRVIHRVMPKTSVAAASLVVVSSLVSAQVGYLLYRTNFYQIPFAASLTLTSLGLWLWLGADTSRRPRRPSDRWQAGDAKPLSLPRLALGALCIAANFGCRPTFTLAADSRAGHRSAHTPHQAVAGVARAAGGNHSRHSRRDASDGVEHGSVRFPVQFRQCVSVLHIRYDPVYHPVRGYARQHLVLPVPAAALHGSFPVAGGLSRPDAAMGLLRGDGRRDFHGHATDLDGFGAAPAAQIGNTRHAAMADVLLGRGGGAGRIRQPRRRFGMAVFRRFRLADLAGVHTGATVAGQWARTEPLIGGGQRRRFRRWHRPRHSVALADALGRDAGRIVGAGHSHTKLLRAVAQRFDDRQQSDALASGSVLVHPAIGPDRSATRQASVFSQHSGRCFPRPAA